MDKNLIDIKIREFAIYLKELGILNEKVYALTADQARGCALTEFKEKIPERFLNMGISEQNAIGVAAGLADEGFIPFIALQAAFATYRCCDQIKFHMSYMKSNIKLVGLFSGITQYDCGPTHYALQDIAIMRSLPNILVMAPCDALETAKMLEAVSQIESPVYIRLGGRINYPQVYDNDYDFKIGEAVKLSEGTDIALISTGTMVHKAQQAASILNQRGLSVKVVNFHTIKPLDINMLKECCNTNLLVTLEEHSIYGGLGSAVAEAIAEIKEKPRQLLIGTPDTFLQAAEYDYLLAQSGLLPEQIANRIFNFYKK